MKTDLLNKFKTAADDAIQTQQINESLVNAVHYLSVLQGCYTGLTNEKEDWALKLVANLLETDTRLIVLKLIGERTVMPADQFVLEVQQLI